MRIVFIQRSGGDGGSKKSLLGTLRAGRQESDIQCRVIVGEEGSFAAECRALGFEPVIAPLPEWRKWAQRIFFRHRMNRLAEQIRSFATDYVISNEMWWAPHARHLAAQLGCRSACFVRDTLAAGPKARQYRLHELDRVLCISAAMKEELQHAAELPDNLRVVYNPVFPPAIVAGADAGLDAVAEQFPRVRKWLLVVGRIGTRKNQIESVRTLGRLHKAGLHDFGLMLAGETDADYLPRLREAIAQFELEDFVCLPGQVAAIGNLIQRCEATLLTSQREGLPRSVIESFLLGKPCFSTPLPGLEEIYGERQSRFVSRGQGAAAIAPIILDGLSRMDELQSDIVAVQKMVAAKFSAENHWRQLKAALA